MKALCFGEVLWDINGINKTLGGAPYNVTYFLSSFGNSATLISALGLDEMGKEARAKIEEKGISTTYINNNDKETGYALIGLSGTNASYSFNNDSSWDNIRVSEEELKAIENGEYDVFIFGTLSQRSFVTRNTLIKLLNIVKTKEVFFDLNLRLNYYSKDVLASGLKRATIIKINEDEEKVVKGLFYLSDIRGLFDLYNNIRIIILTLGEDGSVLFTKEDAFRTEGEKVKAIDTVGAGDSFSATFLHFYFKGEPIWECMKKATALSAFVVQNKGATPILSEEIRKKIKL